MDQQGSCYIFQVLPMEVLLLLPAPPSPQARTYGLSRGPQDWFRVLIFCFIHIKE